MGTLVQTESTNETYSATVQSNKAGYSRFLLLVAGLGGLLYGVDVGIISGALPYLEATSSLAAGQLAFIGAAVLLGGVFSTLFAGALFLLETKGKTLEEIEEYLERKRHA